MEAMVSTTLPDNMWCVCVCVDDNREGNEGLSFLPSFSIREVIMNKCVLSTWTQYVHYVLELLVILIMELQLIIGISKVWLVSYI